jgi:hypothetical protein
MLCAPVWFVSGTKLVGFPSSSSCLGFCMHAKAVVPFAMLCSVAVVCWCGDNNYQLSEESAQAASQPWKELWWCANAETAPQLQPHTQKRYIPSILKVTYFSSAKPKLTLRNRSTSLPIKSHRNPNSLQALPLKSSPIQALRNLG